MSYILDALKRADTERERGAVPGLHTQQMTPSSGQAAPGARHRLWLGVTAAVALSGLVVGLWVWPTPGKTPLAVVLKPVIAQPPISASVAPPVVPTKPATTPILAPVPTPAPRVAAALAPTVSAPSTTAAPLPVLPVGHATIRPEPPKVKPEPIAAAAAPASATLAAVPLLSELPDDLRRQVPALTITGAVYSENPAQRLLLVNNLVLTQGTLAAPEVQLEEIRARSSVFSFRGTRFRVTH